MTAPRPAGGFRVEVDQASQAITELEGALQELFAIRRSAAELAQFHAPAADPVSRDAALALGNVAAEGKGSFPHALDEGIASLQEIIDGLKASLPGYLEADRL